MVHGTDESGIPPLTAIVAVTPVLAVVSASAPSGTSLVLLVLLLMTEVALTTPMFPVARAMRLVGCFIHLRLYLSFCLLAVGPKCPFLSGIHLRKMRLCRTRPILSFVKSSYISAMGASQPHRNGRLPEDSAMLTRTSLSAIQKIATFPLFATVKPCQALT